MIELAEKLKLSSCIVEKLELLLAKEGKNVEDIADKCINDSFRHLKRKSHMFSLAVILNLAVRVKSKYDAAGIDERIYYDTMSDIRIWCEKNGNRGLKNYGWLQNHVKLELFRLGRLQFQLFECKKRTLRYDKLPFSYGEKLIYVHIPEGEKLECELCKSSLKQAEEFFGKYFPQHKYNHYFCESWLLFEGNRDFMRKDSNIVNFMSLFTHCYSVKIDVQAIERIFGKRRIFKKNYPEDTSLQKSAKHYMMQGNRMGVGICVIERKQIRLI